MTAHAVDGTSCASANVCPDLRACCGVFNGDPFCIRTSGEHCAREGGRFFENLQECPQDSCPTTVAAGACCAPDISGAPACALFSREACSDVGGRYQGDDTSCDATDICVEDTDVVCCGVFNNDEFCFEGSEQACARDNRWGCAQGMWHVLS
eukprot:TRINITY_DN293_c0_g1_i3.p3 TRINITY_DN293_c0_g1~~TRINITY_DN293_c0_g1_i3.p3  ORF type:complete len:152 (+),score=13.41 TRINITY_DN293_c0_g1_i3:266-721(+)